MLHASADLPPPPPIPLARMLGVLRSSLKAAVQTKCILLLLGREPRLLGCPAHTLVATVFSLLDIIQQSRIWPLVFPNSELILKVI
jgi:hypothetical protein